MISTKESARELLGLDKVNQVRVRRDLRRLARRDPVLVQGRSQEPRDDQLPHVQAGKGRLVLRAHFRPGQGLGMLLRQVQAHQAPGRGLRSLRRGSDPRPRPPRAHGPHRAGRAGLPHLVLQVHALPHRPGARHDRRAIWSASFTTRITWSSIPATTPLKQNQLLSEHEYREARETSTAPTLSSPRWAPKPFATLLAQVDLRKQIDELAGSDDRDQEQADPQEDRQADQAAPGLLQHPRAVPSG